jgi:hypothetical protein
MTFPDHSIMFVLVSLRAGRRLEVVGGELRVEIPGLGGLTRASFVEGALDALEDRGWVTVEDDGVAITDRGVYATRRYLKSIGHDPDDLDGLQVVATFSDDQPVTTDH